MRILIAEDEPMTRHLLATMVKIHGYEVVMAENGEQAWETMRQPGAPPLLVLDWMMPRLDGLEVCRRIRGLATEQPPYILMLTGNSDKAKVLEGLESGVDDYLVKPCAPAELRARINVGRRMVEAREKLAEKVAELQESEGRFSKLARQSRTIVWEVDAEGLYTYVSQVVEPVLGYRPEELVGKKRFYDLHPEAGRDAFKAAALEVFARKGTFSDVENAARTKDGSEAWLLTNGMPLLDSGGALRGYSGSDLDITDRKRLELQRLEHEKTMRRSEKFSTLGALVASVAHEINNPNSVITMSVPFLRKVWTEATPALLAASRDGMLKAIGKLPPEQALTRVDDMLGGIHRASQRIKRIVQLLRDYIREQPAVLRQDTVNLNEALGSAIDMLGSRLKHATNHLDVKLADSLPPIKGDFQRLEQVFINLLVNSCDALTDKEQAIAVSSGWSPETGEIRVVVRDEGGGMPEDVLSRVGEPLMTTKHDRGGTGLGVSISMDIVREHGGQILYESKPGGGTTATVIFEPMNR